MFKKLIIFICFTSLTSCLDDNTNELLDQITNTEQEQNEISIGVFSDSITDFNLKIFYETGAEPYTGDLNLSGSNVWDITQESYSSFFASHTRTVSVPKLIGDMQNIEDQNKDSWTFNELKNLGDSLAPQLIDGTTANVSVIFLNGKYKGSDSILGIHLGGTYYSFVFKDIVLSVGGSSKTQFYVEQATVVHEIGHSIGLVNNGLPMKEPHEDIEHSHHTTNEDGVMYWAVESPNEILSLLSGTILDDELNLFGNESISDAENYHP